MQAARFHGRSDVRIDEIELAPLGADEARIQVAFAGICGSDVSEVTKGPATCCLDTKHPYTGECLKDKPVVLGHEFSGTVTEVGPGLTRSDIRVGTRVCMKCQFCQRGDRGLCENGVGFVGYNRDGGLAKFVNVPSSCLHIVPEGVTLKEAAVAEPLSVAAHAVKQANVQRTDRVLIVGGGPIGILIMMLCKARGVEWCVVSEPAEARRKAASKQGATATLDPMSEDVVKRVVSETQGGADVVFECAGNQAAFESAVNCARPGTGKTVIVSVWIKPASIDLFSFLIKERTLIASCCFTGQDMKDVLELMAQKKIQAESVVTHIIPLKDVFEKGIKAAASDPTAVKILVEP